MKQVAQGQAGDEDVWAIPHALVLVDDPQQCGVADDAQDEDEAGHYCVDVLERLLDLRLPRTHGRRGRARAPSSRAPGLGQRGRAGGVGLGRPQRGGPGRQGNGVGSRRLALPARPRRTQRAVGLGAAAEERQQQQEGGQPAGPGSGHGSAARLIPRRAPGAVSADLREERERGVTYGDAAPRRAPSLLPPPEDGARQLPAADGVGQRWRRCSRQVSVGTKTCAVAKSPVA